MEGPTLLDEEDYDEDYSPTGTNDRNSNTDTNHSTVTANVTTPDSHHAQRNINDNDLRRANDMADTNPSMENIEEHLIAAETAAAAAEVAVMEGTQRQGVGTSRSSRNPIGEQALMGAVGGDDAVMAYEVLDESGELVRQAFVEFLQNYKQEIQKDDTVDMDYKDKMDNNDNIGPQYIYPYQEQADVLAKRQLARRNAIEEGDVESGIDIQNNYENHLSSSKTGFANTLFVNFEHLLRDDPELSEAIQGEFCRFEQSLRRAVSIFIVDRNPALNRFLEHPMQLNLNYHNSVNTNLTSSDPLVFFCAFFNMPTIHSIRQLRTDLVGSLVCLQGTITRTSDVRPELLVAAFRCNKCGLLADKIPQNYSFTRPTLCRNPRCKNKSPMQFALEATRSEFVDWQKLRVQESSHQIPPGSMPRSMDVILRNEMVEKSKAGDKSVFTGTLVVLPDGSALARAGDPVSAARSAPRPSDAATGGGGGVKGLKALGVRELTYRTCFVATSVMSVETLQQANGNEQVMASAIYGHCSGRSAYPSMGDDDEPTTRQVAMEMTTSQRAELRAMRNSPRLYEQMVDSIAPNTFGHREVKKGVLLMLLGGVHKTTPDGIKLRGDINVCVIGDPSTAKSHFLKYVHSFMPNRAVYTSGKASSAAGLTAAVQRDSDTGEFCIEAGALMLADNGICCIDEFDKMEERDQVAIHEAMEQQTISITKAGIQATLNARASILAAANPIYGRYDRTKTLKANVTLSAPILSRFDLFFVVLDDCNPKADRQVAQHILNVHRCDETSNRIKVPFTKDQMRRYLKFARTLHPKITPVSQRVMVDCYRKLRQGDSLGRSRSAYRITVRQLESMIRLSEALARLHCADEITPAFVKEAYRLLKTSIIQVESSDVEVEDDYDDNHEYSKNEIQEEASLRNDPADESDSTDLDTTKSQYLEKGVPETLRPGQPAKIGEESSAYPSLHSGHTRSSDEGTLESKIMKKKKRKTKISFEEYEAITNAIAGHLRAVEEDDTSRDPSCADNSYLSWQQVMDWYLEQVEADIGDSIEELEAMKKKVNLVIRRLIDVDRILVTVGNVPKNKNEESKTLLAVHPNYEIV